MSKLTVWNSWGITPRDLWDMSDDFYGTDDVEMDMYETKDFIVVILIFALNA